MGIAHDYPKMGIARDYPKMGIMLNVYKAHGGVVEGSVGFGCHCLCDYRINGLLFRAPLTVFRMI